jgi:hypothetical protein
MPHRRRFVTVSSAATLSAGLAVIPSSGHANIVNHTAGIAVGFPTGTSPDVVARLLAEYMKD